MATTFDRGRFVLAALATAVLTLGLTANAQEAEAEKAQDASLIEEIVVTATYRDTQLMDTPIALSAVTDVEIVQKGIQDITYLYQSIPGLNYRANTLSMSRPNIRGIQNIVGGNSPVGAYMDAVPIGTAVAQNSHSLGSLYDIQRVEVLKGPQGTLYGEGSIGGAIRYISKTPDPSGFDYSVRATLEAMAHGDQGNRFDAMLNIPLGEQAAARVVAFSRFNAGIMDAPGLRMEEDVDWTEETGARVRVALQATDTLRITGMYQFTNADFGGPGLGFQCFTSGGENLPSTYQPPQIPFYPHPGIICDGYGDQFNKRDPYVTHLTHPDGVNGGFNDIGLYNVSAEWELPFADLLVSASHLDEERRYAQEGAPNDRFWGGFADNGCGGMVAPEICVSGRYSVQSAYNWGRLRLDRYANELRLVSNTDSRLQWTVGAYFKDERSQSGDHEPCPATVPYGGRSDSAHCFAQWYFAPGTPVEHQNILANTFNAVLAGIQDTSFRDATEQSYFGEVSYRINDQWELLLGARFADVTIDIDTLEPNTDDRNRALATFSLEDRKSSPKVTLTWRPNNDLMIYATRSHGFRPGHINEGLLGAVNTLDAVRANDPLAEEVYQVLIDAYQAEGDEMINYELGVKATLADGRMTFVGSVFSMEWRDMLINASYTPPDVANVPARLLRFQSNIGAAESQGVEIEVRGQVTDALSFSGGLYWNPKADLLSGGAGQYEGTVDEGNRMPAAPIYTVHGSLVYGFELAGFDATARADAYIVDEQFDRATNDFVTPAYQTLDAKLLLRRDDYEVGFFVRNLFDDVVVYEFNSVGYNFGRARTLGVQLNYSL